MPTLILSGGTGRNKEKKLIGLSLRKVKLKNMTTGEERLVSPEDVKKICKD